MVSCSRVLRVSAAREVWLLASASSKVPAGYSDDSASTRRSTSSVVTVTPAAAAACSSSARSINVSSSACL